MGNHVLNKKTLESPSIRIAKLSQNKQYSKNCCCAGTVTSLFIVQKPYMINKEKVSLNTSEVFPPLSS